MLKFTPTTRNLLLFAPNLILVVNKHIRHINALKNIIFHNVLAVDMSQARCPPPNSPILSEGSKTMNKWNKTEKETLKCCMLSDMNHLWRVFDVCFMFYICCTMTFSATDQQGATTRQFGSLLATEQEVTAPVTSCSVNAQISIHLSDSW